MTVPYILKRSRKRKKTISLQISNNAEIVVSAPYFTSDYEINRFVLEKQNWIQNTIQKQKAAIGQKQEKEFRSGEFFYYLGTHYPLEVFFDQSLPPGIVFWGNRFYLNCPVELAGKKYFFIKWYKIKAREYFAKRVDALSRQLQLQPRKIRITSARTRWGSCSEENNLAFTFRLIMAPPEVIDYVIIHELMHIKEKNHSPRFWSLIGTAMPDYKTNRRWLKDNSGKLTL